LGGLLFHNQNLCSGGHDDNDGCHLGNGAWISVTSVVAFFFSSVGMGCSPIIDQWIEKGATTFSPITRQTTNIIATTTASRTPTSKSVIPSMKKKEEKKEQKKKEKKARMISSLDATNDTIITDSSTDYDYDPESSSATNYSNRHSIQKAQRIWGNVFDLEETTNDIIDQSNTSQQQQQQQEQQRAIRLQDECKFRQSSSCPTMSTTRTKQGQQEISHESTRKTPRVFTTDEIYRDLEKALSVMQRSKQQQQQQQLQKLPPPLPHQQQPQLKGPGQQQQPQLPSKPRVVTPPHQRVTSESLPSLRTRDTSSYTNNINNNSTNNTSYLHGNDSVLSSDTTCSVEEDVKSHPNPIVTRMQRSLQNKANKTMAWSTLSSTTNKKKQQGLPSLASQECNWTKCS
jgi:hypothetical protein